jgi:hypothetical protein
MGLVSNPALPGFCASSRFRRKLMITFPRPADFNHTGMQQVPQVTPIGR